MILSKLQNSAVKTHGKSEREYCNNKQIVFSEISYLQVRKYLEEKVC